MIAYLDTSAIVPVLIAEPSSETCRRVWDDADRRVSSRLAYVETAAALAMAQRRRRISATQYDAGWSNFLEVWPDVDVVDLTAELSATAAQFARSLALRGFDAVHCASAAQLNEPNMVAATGDAQLLSAWRSVGIAVIDTNQDVGS